MRGILLVLASILSLSIGGICSADVLQKTERGVSIRYADGTIERYVVAYNGVMDVSHEERGHPAIPEKGWFTDTRQCFWTIQSYVERQIYSTNHQGQRAILEQFNQRFATQFANQGSDFKLLELRSENCNDAQNRYASDLSDAKGKLNSGFDGIVKNDLATLNNVFNQAVNIEVTPSPFSR